MPHHIHIDLDPTKDMPEPLPKSRHPLFQSTFLLRHAIIGGAASLALACHDAVSPSRGTLGGTVVLQDSWGTPFDNFSGAEVSVDGASTTAMTDSNGAWHIDGVPAGGHTITFKKATFGTVVLKGQAVGGPSTTAPRVIMAVTPWQQAVIDSIHVVTRGGRDYYIVDGHLSAPPPSNAKYVSTVVYMGKTDGVSPDTSSFGQWGTFDDITGTSSTFSAPFSVDAARSAFGQGARVYVAGFVSAVFCTCYPADPIGKPFYTNTGPHANVVPLTLK